MINRKAFVVLSAAILLSACNSTPDTPYAQDRKLTPQRVKWDSSEEERIRISYFARFLANRDIARSIVARVHGSEFRAWGAGEYGSAAGMITDGLVGRASSSAGLGVDLAVSLIGFVNNRPQNHLGQIWLSREFKGQKLDTAEEAMAAMHTFIAQRIESVGSEFGYVTTCIAGCGSKNQLFELSRVTFDQDLNYTFIPDSFTFSTNLGNAVEVTADDPLTWLVSDNIAWSTPAGFGFVQEIRVNVDMDEDGTPKVYTDNDVLWLKGGENLIPTEFGREFMRSFHSTPFTTYGGRWMQPNMVFYDGEIYSFVSGGRVDFVDSIVRSRSKSR